MFLPALLLARPDVISAPIVIREALAVRVPSNRRSLLRIDPFEAQIIRGAVSAPTAGEKLGANAWTKLSADKDGWFSGPMFSSSYVHTVVNLDKPKTLILTAQGHTVAYVNSEPRAGDPYQYGYVSVPVTLKAGKNDLYFACGRGRFRASLAEPAKPVSINLGDPTLPEISPAVKGPLLGAVVVTNATGDQLNDVRLRAETATGSYELKAGPIGPLTTRKIAFRTDGKSPAVRLTLMVNRRVADEQTVTLRVRKAGEPYKRTFISEIDGSVQYFGVNPSSNPKPGQALFLSLHGASVEGIGQAEAYAPKSWGNLVAPTNRRPYGFDWEEVGRLDALEVLGIASKEFKSDPQQTYLTGHSMGGHGTWQLGAHFPGRFAAIAPSAGWISFFSYANGGIYDLAKPIEAMLRRASNASDTIGLKANFDQEAIFVLHGDADDNVPVTEARNMRKELAGHPALAWFEQPGAGHWWSEGDEPGARCVDYPAIFDTFARRKLPQESEIQKLRFVTANPGVSSTDQWLTIEQQISPWKFSSADLQAEHFLRAFRGKTENIQRLSLRVSPLQVGKDVTIALDKTPAFKAAWPKDGVIHLRRIAGTWVAAGPVETSEKHPGRSGGFKDILRNRVSLVYGTTGTPDENAWAYAKARFDSESFWYRGNASVDLISDQEFLRRPTEERNVLLYGNADTNSAWKPLLSAAPFQVRRNQISMGGRSLSGGELAALFITARPGTKFASVAAVSGTGVVGMRLTDRCPFFSAGSGIPDVIVFGPEMLSEGSTGIRLAGYFGNRWDVESGDFIWREESVIR